MLSKFLFGTFALLLLARLLVLPRFRVLKEKLDRVVNATLVAIVIVYAGQLLLIWAR